MRKYDLICKGLADLGVSVGAPKEVVSKKTGDRLSVVNFKLESEGVSGSIWLKLEEAKPTPKAAPPAADLAGLLANPAVLAQLQALLGAQAAPAAEVKPTAKRAARKVA